MRRNHFLLLLLFAFVACTSTETADNTDPDAAGTDSSTVIADTPPVDTPAATQEPEEAKIVGYYVGSFRAKVFNDKKRPSWSNRINISVDSLRNGMMHGHSVVAGNSRPFSGKYSTDAGKYQVVAKEPGDDKYDGVFEFVLDPATETVKGIWRANDSKLAVTVREYDLPKKSFRYNPNQELGSLDYYEFYDTYDEETNEAEFVTEDSSKKNPSVEKLSKADVENMKKGDLELMRNSIYARHGYSFKNRRMRYIFDEMVDWYIPVSTDIRAELTSLEKDNIDLIKRYEKHAARYYDSFGR